MGENRGKCFTGQKNDLAKIGKESNNPGPNRGEKSAEHEMLPDARFARRVLLRGEQLRFGFGPQFRRNLADEAWLEIQFPKNRADLAHVNGWLLEFHVNEIALTVDLAAQAMDRFQLV